MKYAGNYIQSVVNGDVVQPPDPTDGAMLMGGAILAFGVIALGLLFFYLHAWKEATIKLSTDSLNRVGTFPRLEQISASVQVGHVGDLAASGTGPGVLTITGPSYAPVGTESSLIEAKLDGESVGVRWTIASGSAQLVRDSGTSTAVIAANEGAIVVNATMDGSVASLLVQGRNRPEYTVGKVPFVGGGYGGLLVAIIAVTIAGAATVLGQLPGAALATLLGTVVAYFFAQASAAKSS